MQGIRMLLPFLVTAAACASTPDRTERARQEIGNVIAAGIEASRRGDVEAFVARLPEDFTVELANGRTASRDDVHRSHLARANSQLETISLTVEIERVEVSGDQATVWTQQRWERRATPPGATQSRHIVTTQRHEELWRHRNGRWEPFRIKELGGDIIVDGVPQPPRQGS